VFDPVPRPSPVPRPYRAQRPAGVPRVQSGGGGGAPWVPGYTPIYPHLCSLNPES